GTFSTVYVPFSISAVAAWPFAGWKVMVPTGTIFPSSFTVPVTLPPFEHPVTPNRNAKAKTGKRRSILFVMGVISSSYREERKWGDSSPGWVRRRGRRQEHLASGEDHVLARRFVESLWDRALFPSRAIPIQ